jgi:hypothetical protein
MKPSPRMVLFSCHRNLLSLSFLSNSLQDFQRLFRTVGLDMDVSKPILGRKALARHLEERSTSRDALFVVLSWDCVVAWLVGVVKGTRPAVALWLQGASPDESLKRHGSRLRWAVLGALEHLSLMLCNVAIVVSTEHVALLCRRHGAWVRGKVVAVPNLLWADSLQVEHGPNVSGGCPRKVSFAYVGGIGVWQNFGSVLSLYASLSDALRRQGWASALHVVVPAPQRDLAERMVREQGLSDAPSITSCSPREVRAALADVDVGFLLRDNSVVNRVASPLKLRDYLAAGVRVLASGDIGVLHDFPMLATAGLVLHVDFRELIENPSGTAERLCQEMLIRRSEPFPFAVLADSFTYEAWMRNTRAGELIAQRLQCDERSNRGWRN